MSRLDPVAFDIETSGFGAQAVITVAGFGHELGDSLVLNVDGREADQADIEQRLLTDSDRSVQVTVAADERELLATVSTFARERIDGDRHYLTAFNGETWNGGFDLPFCRTRFLRHDLAWPFGDLAYVDMLSVVDRFETGDHNDLVGVYEALIGDPTGDPFADSAAAVDAFEDGDWLALLAHNLADIRRTRELATLAGRFVPKSDFNMKNLEPPG